MSAIRENLESIKFNIKESANNAKRSSEDITLIAVTKTVDVDKILEAIEYGVTDVGENKPQELARKYDIIGDKVKWHLIGSLQTNKVKYIIDKVHMIHSLDRESPVSYTHLDVYKRQVIFVSAKTNQRMNKILETVEYVASEHAKRVSTSALNDVIGEAVMLNQPPSDKGKRLKIYYGSQTGVKPPKFTLFINDKNLTHFSYQRYLENKIRENFGFEGTPVQFEYREKNKK